MIKSNWQPYSNFLLRFLVVVCSFATISFLLVKPPPQIILPLAIIILLLRIKRRHEIWPEQEKYYSRFSVLGLKFGSPRKFTAPKAIIISNPTYSKRSMRGSRFFGQIWEVKVYCHSKSEYHLATFKNKKEAYSFMTQIHDAYQIPVYSVIIRIDRLLDIECMRKGITHYPNKHLKPDYRRKRKASQKK